MEMDFDKKEVGKRIKTARIAKELSQLEFAEMLGYTGVSMVGDIERGRKAPSIDKLYLMSKILDVDVDFLIGKRNVKNIMDDINIIFKNIDIEKVLEYNNVDELIDVLKRITTIKEKEKEEK